MRTLFTTCGASNVKISSAGKDCADQYAFSSQPKASAGLWYSLGRVWISDATPSIKRRNGALFSSTESPNSTAEETLRASLTPTTLLPGTA